MTPDEQRIAIAEACGWTKCWFTGSNHDEEWWERKPCPSWFRHPPDYLNDLNAMHEAEKTLTGNALTIYDNKLFKLCGSVVRDMKFATAAQRAEAFLRTIGKYKDKL